MSIFDDVPHQQDDRQSEFAGVVSGQEGVIPTHGFPASSVNLGWLQNRIRDAWRTGDHTIEQIRVRVEQDIPMAVQRLKSVTVEAREIEGATDLQVTLLTKDDHGWYDYGFYVRLWEDRR